MNLARRAMVVFSVFALALTGCTDDPPADISKANGTALEPSPTPSGCAPGKPARVKQGPVVGTIEIESSCPDSKPLSVGTSRKLVLGMVTAKLPCKEWPDFAGSWWNILRPYPKHLAHTGHEYLEGKMTLVSEDRAVFTAKPIDLYMGKPGDPPIRFPAKGNLRLNFKRLEGPVHYGGGCA